MDFEQDIYPNFSLDMVSTDMNFEQAYNMYNDLQHENALNGVEKLQKLQSGSLFSNNQSPQMGSSFMDEGQDPTEEGDESESDEEFQKFFSNTESNALEKFLDNLANSNNVNPLELYNYNFNFKSKTNVDDDIQFKKTHDFTNAFSHPPAEITQLPTPESRQSSVDEEFDYAIKRRKRSTSKPLLSVEQKRLNHSHSEQKRRQLCKLAYERCLRLVTNFETYRKNPPVSKKSKRKQFNKDGLPNLSKYCALNKIANEMIKIKAKNDQLERLLNI